MPFFKDFGTQCFTQHLLNRSMTKDAHHNRIRRGEGKGSVWGKNKITTRCLLHPCHHLVYFLKRKSQQINNDASNCSADHDELPFFDGNMLYYFFYLRGCCCDRRMAERNAKNTFFLDSVIRRVFMTRI